VSNFRADTEKLLFLRHIVTSIVTFQHWTRVFIRGGWGGFEPPVPPDIHALQACTNRSITIRLGAISIVAGCVVLASEIIELVQILVQATNPRLCRHANRTGRARLTLGRISCGFQSESSCVATGLAL
jgi:hypothetical protein